MGTKVTRTPKGQLRVRFPQETVPNSDNGDHHSLPLFLYFERILECACGTGMLTVGMAQRRKSIIATDFSQKMLKRAEKKCATFKNTEFRFANIMELDFGSECFDKVVAANVIHLLDNPERALNELIRVCRCGGSVIIPTYMNKKEDGKDNKFSKTVGKAGADFKKQYTYESYKKFFKKLGYEDVEYSYIDGRVPCAVAVIIKK